MLSLPTMLQSAAQGWLLAPVAVLLGALHGLEPGHSKTMMAAFVIAIRGTVGQAILLGVSAALSHTAVVWIVALGGTYLGGRIDPAGSEPYFQMASGVLVLVIAFWMMWRTWRDRTSGAGQSHHHDHDGPDHHHHHHHDAERRTIATGRGSVDVEVFEDGVPPRWRIHPGAGTRWAAQDVAIAIKRPSGVRETFTFVQRADYLESVEAIAEPHEFRAQVKLRHAGHSHVYELAFAEPSPGHHHTHEHRPETSSPATPGLADAPMDAHARAHAADIARRFPTRDVSTAQIVMFGLTGGFVPCPAAITVLLLCLQLKALLLAIVLVACFSLGVALTMVAAGVLAALSVRQMRKHWSGFDALAARAPYGSGALMILVALTMGASGWLSLP